MIFFFFLHRAIVICYIIGYNMFNLEFCVDLVCDH